ncbi:hypothetical protein G9A89_008573 [Geosiphon pyriformis]|nr:hypothetical protein G9A89_008573 [Geosiphon pyriformis]
MNEKLSSPPPYTEVEVFAVPIDGQTPVPSLEPPPPPPLSTPSDSSSLNKDIGITCGIVFITLIVGYGE